MIIPKDTAWNLTPEEAEGLVAVTIMDADRPTTDNGWFEIVSITEGTPVKTENKDGK